MPYEKVGKNEPVCIADEVPFEIPDSWEWCRLNDVVIKDIKRGKSPKYTNKSSVFVFAQKCNVKTGGIDISLAKYLDMNAFAKYPEEEYMVNEDIVVNSTGNGTLGRIGIFRDSDRINDNIIVPDSHVTIIRSNQEICCDYVLCVLEYYQPTLEKQGEGSTNQTELKPGVLADLYFPLPPYNEQKKIVSSIIALKDYIEKYKIKENMLTQLNEGFPELLKKSILQQAVMGKLVPQDENDEPASVLLEKIREEKNALVKAGKLKKDKHESIIYRRDNSHYEKVDGKDICIDDEIPFEIPLNWAWTRLINVYNFIDYRGKTPTKISSGIPLVTAKNVKKGYIDYSIAEYISEQEYDNRKSRGISHKGDILFTTEAPLGNVAIADLDEYSAGQRLITFQQYTSNNWLNNELMLYFFLSEFFQKQLQNESTGTTVKGIKADKLKTLLIPIPPKKEQDKINKKLKHLFGIIITT